MKKLIQISEEEFKSFEERYRARFINSLSGFKSANLIGTVSNEGQTNVSIISSAFHLGANPALIGFIIRPDVSPRHTLINIRETGICTLNHISKDFVERAHQTSARYSLDQSEFIECELDEEYLEDFKAPFVKNSPLKMALEFVREIPIEENGTHMIISKIKSVWLTAGMLQEDGFIDLESQEVICVSGLDSYHTTSRLGRLSYAKTDKKPTWLK
ncbi:MAG: flavin reductase [Deltaproteobacteria bacterium]|nr:MAG: flavin reductase [Deltaproteobacteria bacterium]TNF26553.1 MAG: flavin reductase [Deltaproteobacteria bacterium]